MKTLISKIIPDLLSIGGALIWFLGVILLQNNRNILFNYFLICSGSFIFGIAGILIIKNKKYSFVFYEIKGILAIIYGSLHLLVGWGIFLLSLFKYVGNFM